MDVDAKGKALGTTTHYKAGEWITPTQAELDAFGDRLEAATEARMPPQAEPQPTETPDEPHAARSRR